jgi:glucose-6-phosphate isomerase
MRYASSYETDLKCSDLPQFEALLAHADLIRRDDKKHLRNLCNDTARCSSMVTIHHTKPSFRREGTTPAKLILDYSRQRVMGETMEQLFDLADAIGLDSRCRAMEEGAPINLTEGKPVLHHLLRTPTFRKVDLPMMTKLPGHDFSTPSAARTTTNAGTNLHHHHTRHHPPPEGGHTTNTLSTEEMGRRILREVHESRTRIQEYAFRVRSGEITSVTGSLIRNFVVVVTGGTFLGIECIAEALRGDASALEAAGDRRLVCLSHADPMQAHLVLKDLDPGETLVVIISQKFQETPVTLNAKIALKWLLDGLPSDLPRKREAILKTQVVAVAGDFAAARTSLEDLGILDYSNVYYVPSWVSPRFSVWSAMGLLPLSLQYSYPVMSEVLDGAHDMDEHFFHAPLRDNMPVIMGLLGVWNSTFLGYSSRAVLPYAHPLHRFPAYVQNVDMESNGKRVALDGVPLDYRSGEVNLGDVHWQYMYSQLLHQGRVVPADFIGFIENKQGEPEDPKELTRHDELMADFFAQPDALAYGKTMEDLVQEGVDQSLRPHMVFSGNRPSTSLLLTRLDAFSIGQLMVLFEHRTAVQGFIWGINSFDQFGLELSTMWANHVRSQLAASRKTDVSVQGFNASTSALLEQYLAYGKQNK